MLKVIKFRKVKNQSLTKLKNNIKTVNKSKKTLTFANKTSNMYRLNKEEHEELLTNALTSNLKKTNNSIKKKINMGGKQNFKKQQNSKPHRNQSRKQLLLHIKRPQG